MLPFTPRHRLSTRRVSTLLLALLPTLCLGIAALSAPALAEDAPPAAPARPEAPGDKPDGREDGRPGDKREQPPREHLPRLNRGDFRDGAERPEGESTQLRTSWLRDIDLSAEQKTKLEEIQRRAAAEGREWQAKHGEAMATFRRDLGQWMTTHGRELGQLKRQLESAQEAGNAEEARKVCDDVTSLLADRPRLPEDARKTMPSLRRTLEQVRGVLTEEQRARLEKNMQSHREQLKPEHKGGRPGGPKPEQKPERPGKNPGKNQPDATRRV